MQNMQNMQNISPLFFWSKDQKSKISESESLINSRTCLGHLVLFHSWNPLLWQLLIILVWFFLDFCNNFDLIPELSLPRNLFLMSQSMEIKNFRFWDNTAIKSVDHFIWNFEGLIQVSFRGIPVQFCFWYSRLIRHMTQSVLGFLRETICGKGRTLGDLLRCQATIPLYQQYWHDM